MSQRVLSPLAGVGIFKKKRAIQQSSQLFLKKAANRGFSAQDEQKDLKIGPLKLERNKKKKKTLLTGAQDKSLHAGRGLDSNIHRRSGVPEALPLSSRVAVLVLHRRRSCRFQHAARFFVSRKAERAAAAAGGVLGWWWWSWRLGGGGISSGNNRHISP